MNSILYYSFVPFRCPLNVKSRPQRGNRKSEYRNSKPGVRYTPTNVLDKWPYGISNSRPSVSRWEIYTPQKSLKARMITQRVIKKLTLGFPEESG